MEYGWIIAALSITMLLQVIVITWLAYTLRETVLDLEDLVEVLIGVGKGEMKLDIQVQERLKEY